MTKKDQFIIQSLRKAVAVLLTSKGFERRFVAAVFNVDKSQLTRLLGRKRIIKKQNEKKGN